MTDKKNSLLLNWTLADEYECDTKHCTYKTKTKTIEHYARLYEADLSNNIDG